MVILDARGNLSLGPCRPAATGPCLGHWALRAARTRLLFLVLAFAAVASSSQAMDSGFEPVFGEGPVVPDAVAVPQLQGAAVRLVLVGGEELQGFFLDWWRLETLRINTTVGPRDVPWALVERGWVAGEALERVTLEQARARWVQDRVPEGPTPAPALVGGLSLILPGTGHLILGKPRVFAACATVDVLLLAAGAYGIHQNDTSVLMPVVLADGLLRLITFEDAVRQARDGRRRANLVLVPTNGGLELVLVSSAVPAPQAIPRRN